MEFQCQTQEVFVKHHVSGFLPPGSKHHRQYHKVHTLFLMLHQNGYICQKRTLYLVHVYAGRSWQVKSWGIGKTDRLTHRPIGRLAHRHTYRQTDTKQTDRQADRQADRDTDREADRHTEAHTQTYRQADKQADRQIDRPKPICTLGS